MASLENKPRRGRVDDIEAARQRVEDESENDGEGGGQQIQFEEGFTGKVMVGTLFVCLVMLPGSIYLGLVAGQGLGPAAQWVTIVLFSEIARRSFLPLKRQARKALRWPETWQSPLKPRCGKPKMRGTRCKRS